LLFLVLREPYPGGFILGCRCLFEEGVETDSSSDSDVVDSSDSEDESSSSDSASSASDEETSEAEVVVSEAEVESSSSDVESSASLEELLLKLLYMEGESSEVCSAWLK
jgi:hypothetical protein